MTQKWILLQALPKKKPDSSSDTLAKFCYHFPQYKYHEAREMPFKRVQQMLIIARKEYAHKMIDLTNIAAAPHSAKGKGVKKMVEFFSRIIED